MAYFPNTQWVRLLGTGTQTFAKKIARGMVIGDNESLRQTLVEIINMNSACILRLSDRSDAPEETKDRRRISLRVQ